MQVSVDQIADQIYRTIDLAPRPLPEHGAPTGARP
jgi:hypothetical protein